MFKLFIRAHDLGVKNEENISAKLNELGLDRSEERRVGKECG